MSEITARVKAAATGYTAVREAVTEYREELRQRRAAEFAEAGGCHRCRGRGWVVTWDTLDSLSGCYAEYGGCPDAESNPGAHGEGAPFDHSKINKYDNLQGEKPELAQTPEEREKFAALELAVKVAAAGINAAQADARPSKGKTVTVIKGRKVAKGTVGRVFWTGPSDYGPGLRVGLETPEGERHFTAGTNLEVIAL